jgi:hypothetical protein
MEYILFEVELIDESFQFSQPKLQWNVEEVEGHEELQNPTNNKTSPCNNKSLEHQLLLAIDLIENKFATPKNQDTPMLLKVHSIHLCST